MVTIEPASEENSVDRGESIKAHATSGDHASDLPEPSGYEQTHKNAGGNGDKTNLLSCDSRVAGKEEHAQANHDGDDWETASEGDDNGADDLNVLKSGNVNENYEDALTEEEQRQRALSQANASKLEGNELYAAGKYEEALSCYSSALEFSSDHESSNEIRAMCYSNSAMCHLQLKQYEEAVEQSTKALELNPTYVKAFLRRAQGQEKLDHLEEALADLKKVVELSPENQQARESVFRLEPIVAERREKMKEEMLGKLKDLGNSVLGRFGMNLDNFKAVQDPNTGSYSISFQR